jgi:hypothetical protein
LRLMVIEETVNFTVAAKYKTLTTYIPANAVIHCVQANITSAVTAGGTSVKIGLGDHSGTTNTYGLTSGLTKNLKITTPVTPALFGGGAIDVCVTTTAGTGLGDTNASAGAVRVRIVYEQVADLANAP